MTVFEMLGTILIGPLKLVFEFIFAVAYRFIGHPGLAIIALSLAMNILVLPLYKRADAMQEEARDIEAKLSKGVKHIKKMFSGDERMMILQTYYRQNHYSPLSVMNGSVSLLLEIPFFMAAYQFLSNLAILNGVSLGPIANLGAPDGLIVLGGLTLNLLPILMTLVNVISSAIYLKGFPLKTKIQLYSMALFFLVFLYNSPSCLVFYWTLNNVFSLVKTVFYKIKNPRKVLKNLGLIAGVLLLCFVVFAYDETLERKLVVGAIAMLMIMPTLLGCVRRKEKSDRVLKTNRRQYILSCIFLTILIGLLIPTTYIAASPLEYVDVYSVYHPLWYAASSFCLAAGLFLVWMNVFYWLADTKIRVILEKVLWVMCGVALVNYLFFGTNLGTISNLLQYENEMHFTLNEQILNLAAIAVTAALLVMISLKKAKVVSTVLLTTVLALSGMAGMNINTITEFMDAFNVWLEYNEMDAQPSFRLSQTGKNVIVVMLDRALGGYMPYFFEEKPELKEQFAGFTHYANTVSLGIFTNLGVPAVLGGYEYTPVEMNRRKDELLVDKHNEALKVMPVLFSENGFETTMCDPTYANYSWRPDLSVFDEYPQIDAYITEGWFTDLNHKSQAIHNNLRNFFWFSLMKTMPLALQPALYDEGQYNQTDDGMGAVVYSTQMISDTDVTKASGLDKDFMVAYDVLINLPTMTEITGDNQNTFLYLANNATHEPCMLQLPDYRPQMQVDNSAYADMFEACYDENGRFLRIIGTWAFTHYQTNMATMIQLGKWFDYMREHDVYDNTRIILVADHGVGLYHWDELIHWDEYANDWTDVSKSFPLLMVKDFDAKEFATSYEFMTNADVPTLAVEGLIESPRNPFTGKMINNDEKYAHEQFISLSDEHDTRTNNGNTFIPSRWISVKDNIWNKENWTFYEPVVALDEYAAP